MRLYTKSQVKIRKNFRQALPEVLKRDRKVFCAIKFRFLRRSLLVLSEDFAKF